MALASCNYAGSGTTEASGSEVGGTGNIKFTHERMGVKNHMLIVSASPGLGETEGSVAQRISGFANRFAAKTCPGTFDFSKGADPEGQMSARFMERSKTYTFSCS
ncbi:hypothetical protein FQV39_03400 [Bosea sp. F3-2]|uniref:hypothetical protein n=1 Tax=Bosea sp. F3-2 TaxID=2599640 RepID=UPI0011EE84EB|nr:hypothetical protein [Bosea sp. F3-2]QEL21728.1 hypothetical protein FQV39_03400 [Bosea sp. F3-2]